MSHACALGTFQGCSITSNLSQNKLQVRNLQAAPGRPQSIALMPPICKDTKLQLCSKSRQMCPPSLCYAIAQQTAESLGTVCAQVPATLAQHAGVSTQMPLIH